MNNQKRFGFEIGDGKPNIRYWSQIVELFNSSPVHISKSIITSSNEVLFFLFISNLNL